MRAKHLRNYFELVSIRHNYEAKHAHQSRTKFLKIKQRSKETRTRLHLSAVSPESINDSRSVQTF